MNKEDLIPVIVQEECSEVIQAISKIFRFGFDNLNNGISNKQHLEEELGQLCAMMSMLYLKWELNRDVIAEACSLKTKTFDKWSAYFKEQNDCELQT